MLIRRLTVLFLVALAALEAGAEVDSASQTTYPWEPLFEHRLASGTRQCTVRSWEGPVGVVLTDGPDGRAHQVVVGNRHAPGSDAWARVDEREPFRIHEGVMTTEDSWSLVRDMLLGAHLHIEWNELGRGVETGRLGLGRFAAAYADCRRQMEWGVPDSLQRVLDLREERRQDFDNNGPGQDPEPTKAPSIP